MLIIRLVGILLTLNTRPRLKVSQCKLLHGVGPAFSSVPRPTGEAECLAWKAHRKDKKMLCMCRKKDLCGLRIYEAAVLPQKKSKLYYNSCLVAKISLLCQNLW